MQLLAVAAWPVLPLWVAIARVRQLMELACDEAALADADAAERQRYGHALLDLAEWQWRGMTPLATGELQFGSMLRTRVRALAAQRHWRRPTQMAFVLVAATGLVACGLAAPGPSPGDGATSKAASAPDVVTECPNLLARVITRAKRSDNRETLSSLWQSVPVDGIPPDEVERCRSPRILSNFDESVWASEGRNNIGAIVRGAALEYEKNGRKLCPGGPSVPSEPLMRGATYQPKPAFEDWATPSWMCLRFAVDQTMRFNLAYQADATSFTVTAHGQRARGDHFVDVTMVIRGRVGPDRRLVVEPNIEETWKDVP
jgi:hypothetical protein